MTMNILQLIAQEVRSFAGKLTSIANASASDEDVASEAPGAQSPEFRPGDVVSLNQDYAARQVGAEKGPDGVYPKVTLAAGTQATVIRCGARGPVSVQTEGGIFLISRRSIRVEAAPPAPEVELANGAEEAPASASV